MPTVHSLLFKTHHDLKGLITESVPDIPDNIECVLCETFKPTTEYITHQYKRRNANQSHTIRRYQYCKECRTTSYKHLNTTQSADAMIGVIVNKLIELGIQYNIDRFDSVISLIPSRLFIETYRLNAPDNMVNAVVNPTILKREVVRAFKSLIKLYNHENGDFVPMIQRYEALYNEARRVQAVAPAIPESPPSNINSIETAVSAPRVVRTRVVRPPILRAKRVNQTTDTLASTEN